MDDVLASQQLVEEGARAEHAASDGRGRRSPTRVDDMTDGPGEEHLIDLTTHPDPTASQQTLPSSPPSITINNRQSLTPTGEDAPASPLLSVQVTPRSHNEVEVPDSQSAPAPALGHLPMTPIATSGFAIPSTMQTSNIAPNRGLPANAKENTVTDAAELSPASAPQTKRNRKRSYATPPSTQTGSERATATSEHETSTMLSSVDVMAGAEGATTSIKQSSKKKRGQLMKNLKKSVPTESMDDNNATAHDDVFKGRLMHVRGKLRRLKKSKPFMSVERSDNGNNDASEVVETPRLSKRRKGKNNATDVDLLGWEASAHTVDQLLANATPQDPSPDEENLPDDSPSKHATPKPKRETKRRPATTNTPSRRYIRRSNVDTTILAADRELNTTRILNHPPVLPDSGKFTQDEDEILRRAILDYQQRKEISTMDLIAIIQWTDPSLDHGNTRKKSEWAPQELEDEAESKEFWKEIRYTEPQLKRKPETIKRHIQARYHAFKSGAWTEEEDEMLKELMAKHPNQWKTLSLIMGDRSAIDIQNRWKDYVQHGDQRNTSRWTIREEESLLSALSTVVQRDEDERDATGLPSVAEYSNKDINWSEVCNLMGNIRSRLQCTVKWTQMKERDTSANVRPVYKRGRTPDPNQQVEPTPKKKKKKSRKSEAHLASGDEEGETVPQKKRGRSRSSKAQPDHGEIDDAAVVSKKRRKSRAKQGKKSAEAVPEETLKEDVAVPAKGSGQEVAAREEDDDQEEAAPEDANEEVIATAEEHKDHEKAASEEVNEENVTSRGEADDQEGIEPKEINEEDNAVREDSGRDVPTLEENDESEVATAEGDNDQEEAATEKDSEHDVVTPTQDDEQEVVVPDGDKIQEEMVTEEDGESGPSDPVHKAEIWATPQVPDSSMLRTPQRPGNSAQVPPGVGQMKWGDKFDIVDTLALLDDVMDDDDVNWRELATLMRNNWSVRDLQAAIEELLKLVPNQGTWTERITDLHDHLTSHVDRDKLKEHYDPFEAGPFEEEDMTKAGLLAETEMRAEASKPNTKKKRKRDSHDKSSCSRSERKRGKRKKRKSMPTTPSVSKSAMIVKESDDAESA